MDNEQNSSGSKRPFGLSFPSRPKNNATTLGKMSVIQKNCAAAAAFSLDDDDEDISSSNLPTAKRKPPALNTKGQRQIEQALEEDPNIYEYDNVYETVSSVVQQEKRQEEKRRIERESNEVRKPKYVTGLLEKSKEREKEFERVIERKIQREREQEGDLYADKEVFVTPTYKAKLVERQADLEREKLEEKREAMLNVKNQDNMNAFYRFQFKLRTGEAVILEQSEKSTFNSTTPTARQLRTREEDEDEDAKTEEINAEIYARAREKHSKKTQKTEEKEESDNEPVQSTSKPIQSTSKPVKVRRINDESSRVYDDEQIEMGVRSGGKKKKENEKPNEVKIENPIEAMMPLAAEKKRAEQETRIERVRRLCIKRTVGEVLEKAKEAFFERQQRRRILKDYIERAE